MPVDAFLFDKDGTLFDFAATWNSWAAGVLKSLARGDVALAGVMADTLRFDLERECFHPDSFVIAGTNGEVAAALASRVDVVATLVAADASLDVWGTAKTH